MKYYSDTVLASYKRSGNTWLRYCIEYLSEQPTCGLVERNGLHNERERPLGETLDLGVSLSLPYIVRKEHKGPFKHYKKGILIVRNPLECIVREKKNNDFVPQNLAEYAKIIEQFLEAFEPDSRCIIKYENLLEPDDIESVLLDLIEFLNISRKKLNMFLYEFDTCKYECIKLYESIRPDKNGKSETKGKHKIWHSKTVKEPKKWKEFFQNEYPDIFNEYLSEYFKEIK